MCKIDPISNDETFSECVRMSMAKRKLRYVWLSQEAGLSQARLAQFMNGYYKFPQSVKDKIATLLTGNK